MEDAAKRITTIGSAIHPAVIHAMDAATGLALRELVATGTAVAEVVLEHAAVVVVYREDARQRQAVVLQALNQPAVAQQHLVAEQLAAADTATNERLSKYPDAHFSRLGPV